MSISPVPGNDPSKWPYPYDPAQGPFFVSPFDTTKLAFRANPLINSGTMFPAATPLFQIQNNSSFSIFIAWMKWQWITITPNQSQPTIFNQTWPGTADTGFSPGSTWNDLNRTSRTTTEDILFTGTAKLLEICGYAYTKGNNYPSLLGVVANYEGFNAPDANCLTFKLTPNLVIPFSYGIYSSND